MKKGIHFVKLQMDSVKLIVYADASFASNGDLTSQLGFIFAMVDKYGRANVIDYSSVKAKRITRSVLAAELFSCVRSFYSSSTTRVCFNEMLSRMIPMTICTDSKCLYDMLISLNKTTEKRLLIDLQGLREVYELREIDEILLIPSEENPADSLTKSIDSNALQMILEENRVELNPNAWVERVKRNELRHGFDTVKKGERKIPRVSVQRKHDSGHDSTVKKVRFVN